MTHNSVTGFMPAELMYGQKPIMPVEHTISSWAAIDWTCKMSREELFAARIRQLERRPEDIARAKAKLHAAPEKKKDRFDRTHRLRPRKIEEGDWAFVYDNNLDYQHNVNTRKRPSRRTTKDDKVQADLKSVTNDKIVQQRRKALTGRT